MTPRFLVSTLAVSLLIVGFTPARHAGDGVQYFLMLQSLADRGSPALAEQDAAEVCRIYRSELHSDLPEACDFPPFGYFRDARGALYSYHFWFYALLAVLPRLALRAAGLPASKAFLATNVLILWGLVLFAVRSVPPRSGWWPALIVLGNPILWYLNWPHPEVICYAAVIAAMMLAFGGRERPAIVLLALASLQNPPIIVAALATLLLHLTRLVRERALTVRAASLSLAALAPAALAPAFYYAHFHTINLIAARGGAEMSAITGRRIVELMIDPNLGLLPYAPVTTVLGVIAVCAAAGHVVVAVARRKLSSVPVNAALLAALGTAAVVELALAASTTTWNDGSSGPSRYVVWSLLPICLIVSLNSARWRPAAIASLVINLVIVSAGLLRPLDYLDHSYAARLVLRYAPRLYNPTPEIFLKRTLHTEHIFPVSRFERSPVLYRDAGGACRKVWVFVPPGESGRTLVDAAGAVCGTRLGVDRCGADFCYASAR